VIVYEYYHSHNLDDLLSLSLSLKLIYLGKQNVIDVQTLQRLKMEYLLILLAYSKQRLREEKYLRTVVLRKARLWLTMAMTINRDEVVKLTV